MKKAIHELRITELRYPNKGIALLGTEKVTVKHGLPGQLLEVACIRKRKKLEGKLLRVVEPADWETTPTCPGFGECGGCAFLTMPYAHELELKAAMLRRLFGHVWDDLAVVPAPNPVGYRNKMEFSFGDEGPSGRLALGIRKRNRYYEVTAPKACALIPEDFKTLALHTLDFFRECGEAFYHRMRRTGTLRYLILRRGEFTGELQANLVTTGGVDAALCAAWAQRLQSAPLAGKLVGVLHTISDALSDAVVPEACHTLWGRPHFYEKLCGLGFEISPFAFFQTYSAGAELLYQSVKDFAGAGERIFDLYCGTGTIAQILADGKNADIIGIERLPEAVAAAEKNALANGITNCRFFAGDVLHVMRDKAFAAPDTLVLDPPRDGVHPKALAHLLALEARRVVYVSCKPTSLVRDLERFFESGYRIAQMRFHDMFPRTPHVETVCLLVKDGEKEITSV